MSQNVTVDFGSFKISSYLDKNFMLAVSTSIVLSVPAQYPATPTAAGLRDQVQAGSLWITRAGSCHIELTIGFGDSLEDASRRNLQRIIVEAFEDFPVWDALGLDIRREYNQFNELRGLRSLYPYSVQYRQQNASLIVPDQVPCAYLSVLTCNFIFQSKAALVNIAQCRPLAKRRKTKIVTLCISPRDLRRTTAAKQHQVGATVQSTPLPKKSRVVTLRAPPGELRRVLGVPEIYSVALELQETRLQHLTHTALHSIFGTRKRINGIHFLDKSRSPTALEVAPAVWNAHYFQDVVSRAQLTPLVSSALGNLTSTRSPNLRHKIQSLGVDPALEIHRQTLLLVLRSTRVPKPQFRVQRTASRSQTPFHLMTEDDQVYISSESRELSEAREPLWPRQNKPPNDGTLSHVKIEVDVHDISSSDPAYDESSSTYNNDAEMDEALDFEYGMPYSYSNLSAAQPIPEYFQEPCGFDNDPLLDDKAFQEGTIHASQAKDDQEQQDDLVFDAMDEAYGENGNAYAIEELVGQAARISEYEQASSRYNRDDCVSDTRIYGEDDGFEGHQQYYTDAGTRWEHHPAYQQHFQNLDDTEYMEDERSDGDHWTEQDIVMGPGSVPPPYGVEQISSEYEDSLMDDQYDADSLHDVMDQGPVIEGVYQYEDMSMHPSEGFTNEDGASVATGQGDSVEIESVLEEPQDDDTEGCDCDGAEDESGSALEDTYTTGGEESSHLSTRLLHHHSIQENGLGGRVSQPAEVLRQRNWAASRF